MGPRGGPDDGKVQKNTKWIGRMRRELERGAGVRAIAFSPRVAGAMFAVGSTDCKVALVDAATGKVIREIERNGAVNTLAFSPIASTWWQWSTWRAAR